METIPLKDVIVEDRLREDLGEVDELAESIRDHGLMQPIVIDDQNNLIAGGRRYTAFTLLATNEVESPDPTKYLTIPYVRLGTLSPAKRRLLELEENVRRKDMTWQEQVIGLAEYHRLAEREAFREGEEWTQKMTGGLVGLSQASVSIALMVAKELKNPESEYHNCGSLRDAIQLKTMKKLDEAAKEQLRRIQLRQEQAIKNQTLAKAQVQVTPTEIAQVSLSPAIMGEMNRRTDEQLLTARPALIPLEDIARMYLHGNCIELIPQIAKTQVINHIICDPPFGIDMDNLEEKNVERVVDEHQVAANLELLQDFLKVSYDNIAQDGFLCMWYDLDHHEKIAQWAAKIGWKVCRWPLVWCKTSPCRNSAAQYNITKSTEVCYFFRRSEASFIKAKQPRNYILSDAVRSATHPFVKPRIVWQYCIDTVSTEKQTILDPFAGEGSGLAAIFNSRRIPLGIELKKEHIANGLNYIQKELSTPVFSTNELLSELPV